ncbi:MAG: twin-arginine translocase subunit TatC [Firmicutes bacterium]|nr:twin-arginine translocase subunit TatC [Bacillota bacterium]MCM1401794.1 twin-arginine translocase subunit TatC [Bacteroides sp.]MCM1477669.1 twin-arginine translocase subunit TatC [Bacteroides sp.]
MQAAPESDIRQNQNLSFWDHLDVLRALLLRGAIVVAVFAVALFAAMPSIFNEIILAPCRPDFATYRWLESIAGSNLLGLGGSDANIFSGNVNLVNINLASQLMIHLSTSFWIALVAAVPVLLWLLWRFIAPALYDHERRPVSLSLMFGTLLFYVGAAVCYMMIFPLTLRFLASYQLSPLIPNVISLDSYMDTLTGMMLAMGLMFELPVLAWLLGRFHILNRDFFKRYRRHAICILLILAAIITPTGDPFTLALVFLPLYLLWELSSFTVPAG